MPRPAPANDRSPIRDRLIYGAIRGLLAPLMALPYAWRVPAMGWLTARLIAPALGWDKRIRANLAHVLPDLPQAEVRRLTRAVPDNWGRTLIEIFSGPAFIERVRDTKLTGPGAEPFRAARKAGKRVILVTAHFGNYDAPRAALFAQGHALASLYRRPQIDPFARYYVSRIERIGAPVYPATRRGLTDFLRYLKARGLVGILIDVHAGQGAHVTYFGKVAPTATSVAEWAVKYDAEVIPIYGRRRPDGLSFDIILDTPIARDTPEAMTQALNDSLESMVRPNMDQWFWIHRRWKPERRGEAPGP